MQAKHKAIQKWYARNGSSKWHVETEATTRRLSKLPLELSRNPRTYNPDCIAWLNGRKTKIKYLVEVENDPSRKQFVGTIILADHALGLNDYHLKETELIFVIYSAVGIVQINDFKKRKVIALTYTKYLKKISVLSERDFKIRFQRTRSE